MTASWDEIKRLAADFQKLQLSSTLQKLSEPNCIEVVNLLIEKQLLNVIFTVDGKEYITPEHLQREIEDELYAHGGRINLVELAKILNVDLSRINAIVEQIAEENKHVTLLLGQLINEDYVERIAAEINELLRQKGEISVYELAISHFDLPTDFLLHNVLEKYLGTIIHARQSQEDNNKFFTQKYISRCRAKLRGSLAGLTMPTSVSTFFQNIGAQDAMYHSLITELNTDGVVTSKQKGALYIPHIYSKTQADWVDSFYKQNGYLEYDAVARLGVTSPMNFIKRQITDEKCTFLSKCCVDRRIIEQVEAALEDCISNNSYLDALTILPSVMIEEDVAEILSIALKPNRAKSVKLFGTTVLTTHFLEELLKPCENVALTNAKNSVENGEYQQHLAEQQSISNKHNADLDADTSRTARKDDRRRKATGGKVGGGTQGRETKTKSTKKLYRPGGDKNKQSDSEDDDTFVQKKKVAPTLQIISQKNIEKLLEKQLEVEGLNDLSDTLAEYFYPQLSKTALAAAQTLYEASIQSSTQNRRQTHADLQERLNSLLVDIRLYEKGLKLLPAAVQPQLIKYLLKTLGTDVCNHLVAYVAAECNLTIGDKFTPEIRTKISQECDQEYKSSLSSLIKTLSGNSIDEFLSTAETALQSCSMILKKIDKKKDKNLILCHKHGLLDQLSSCTDPALVLHLTVLVIFTVSTQNMLHASGKQVSAILSYLQPILNAEQSKILTNYHSLVLKLLSAEADTDDSKQARDELENLISAVKDIGSNFKKAGVTAAD